jgi:uncharacterized iron-regulated membrane protein
VSFVSILVETGEVILITPGQGRFRQSMLWLHTWTGIVFAIVLYFIFITGSIGYFQNEITYWMEPETPLNDKSLEQKDLLNVAEQRLKQVAADSTEWWVDFPIGRQYSLMISWLENSINQDGSNEEIWHEEILDYDTGKPVNVRDTGGGATLYAMHYSLHYLPNIVAYWLVSFCSMFMFVGLITGIIIHKQIFKDFFTFRSAKKQHSWRDLHTVLSVLPLPFHLMMTYSGLLFFVTMSMPSIIGASYGFGDENLDRYYDDVYLEDIVQQDAAGIKATSIDFSDIFSDITKHIGSNNIDYIGIENRGDINAYIEVSKSGYDGLSDSETYIFHGVTGQFQSVGKSNESTSMAKAFYDTLFVLHEGKFSDYSVRWLYFISGLMGAGMIASGMILWATKRRERTNKKGISHQGLINVERLNIGIIVGLPTSIAIYFWLNRLLPKNFEARSDWEINGLFFTWSLLLVYPFLASFKYNTKQIWTHQLMVASLVYGLLPLINYFTTNVHLGITLSNGHWVLAGFDLFMLLCSFVFGLCAVKLSNSPSVVATYNSAIKLNKHEKPLNKIVSKA